MEVLNPIHMAPILNIYFALSIIKRGGADRMFPFAKRNISEWSSRYEPKSN